MQSRELGIPQLYPRVLFPGTYPLTFVSMYPCIPVPLYPCTLVSQVDIPAESAMNRYFPGARSTASVELATWRALSSRGFSKVLRIEEHRN